MAIKVPPTGETVGVRRLPLYYGWVIVAVVFLAEFTTAGMGGLTIGLFFKPMSESLGWSLTQLVGAVTAQAIAGMITSPLIGPLLDRIGARPVMAFGALFAGVGLLLLMGVNQVWQFWILYAAVGALGLSELGGLTAPVVISKWFIRKRGRAMSVATLGITVGGMVMASVIGQLIEHVGWRGTWGLMGAIMLLVILPLVLMFMRRQPEDLGLKPDGDAQETSLHKPSGTSTKPKAIEEPVWTLREAMGSRSLWLLLISTNLISFSSVATVIHAAPFFTRQEGMSTVAASFVVTLRLMGATLSRIPWGFVVDRVPVRVCLAIMCLARSLGDLSLVLVPYPFNIITFVLFPGILGGANSLLQPMAFANYFGRTFLGTIQGTLRPFLALPQLVGPLFIAMLFEATGTFNVAFLITSMLGFLAMVVILFATPPVHRTPSLAKG